MKRLTAMLMMLCVLLSVSGGMASSLFTLPSTSDVEAAVSYGVTFGKTPASESTLADGSIKQVYTQVKDDDFLSFGTVLAERGYSAVSQQMVDGVAETVVAKGDIRFTVAYDQAKHSLSVVYPADTNVEVQQIHNPFEELERSGELIRVEVGESFKLDKLCKMTIKNIYLDDQPRIEVEIENIAEKYLNLTFDLEWTLQYVNEDGSYAFEGECSVYGGTLDPLEKANRKFVFDNLPDKVKTADDGYLVAIVEASSLRETADSKQYIVYFREP